MSDPAPRAHKKRQSGVAAVRKKERHLTRIGVDPKAKKLNTKALSFSSVMSADRKAQHGAEMRQRKEHSAVQRNDAVDRPPPFVVAIAGPPGTGKTTLLKCLVRKFTNQPTHNYVGPVTVTVNQNRRITFIEVTNDIGAMIDVAKIADLVLLTVDASFGFEMETFEFLNILKTHGLPKVMGVLTHLDGFRDNKTVRKMKKRMKKRFWSEICDGAKIFYLSGLIHGKYPYREILNLSRKVGSTKFRPMAFRNEHGYVVCDRMEDLTHPGSIQDNAQCDRTVALYGYVRGTSMRMDQNVHLIGVGDFQINQMQVLPDPLPIASHYNKNNPDELAMRQSLKRKDLRLYAPMSDIGHVMYDKDAIYIKMKSSKVQYTDAKEFQDADITRTDYNELTEEQRKYHEDLIQKKLSKNLTGQGTSMIRDLQNKQQSINDMLDNESVSLFKDSKSITSKQFEQLQKYRSGGDSILDDKDRNDDVDSDDNNSEDEQKDENDDINKINDVYNRMEVRQVADEHGRMRKKVVFMNGEDLNDDNDDDSEDDDMDSDDQHGNSRRGAYDDDDDEAAYAASDDEEQADAMMNKIMSAFEGEEDDLDMLEGEDEDMMDYLEDEDEDGMFEDEDEEEGNAMEEDLSRNAVKKVENGEVSWYLQEQLGSQAGAWKELLASRAAIAFKSNNLSLTELVYGSNKPVEEEESDEEEYTVEEQKKMKEDDDFFTLRNSSQRSRTLSKNRKGVSESSDKVFANTNEKLADTTSKKSALGLGYKASDGDMYDSVMRIKVEKEMSNWEDFDYSRILKDRFVTGNWEKKLKYDDDVEDEDAEDDESGDDDTSKSSKTKEHLRFSDERDDSWDTDAWGKGGGKKKKQSNQHGNSDRFIDENDDLGHGLNNDDEEENDGDIDTEKSRIEGKLKLKSDFLDGLEDEAAQDEREEDRNTKFGKNKKEKLSKSVVREQFDYFAAQKEQIRKRIEANKEAMQGLSENEKLILQGAIPGKYVRIILTKVPCEFVENFNPVYPCIIGSLLHSEQNLGIIQARFKKHRWHPRVLKTNDPLVFSMGWRRFQSLPIYSVEDRNNRLRYLKYTPEHMHCMATFYGPVTATNSGLMAFKNIYLGKDNKTISSFRVAATGTVLEVDKSTKIVKKLKLIGTPFQINKNTAYIQNMFTSALEVAKFEGAKLRTVSGIRGQIKKAVLHAGKEGCFRATFEDKILKSDIVFLRTWTVVKPFLYYNPVMSMLLSNKGAWRGMRTHKELRKETATPLTWNKDSEYKEVVRENRKFNPLRVPASLQAALPFSSKPKMEKKRNHITLEQRRARMYDLKDSKTNALVTQLATMTKVSAAKQKDNSEKRKRKREHAEEKEDDKHKERRKYLMKKALTAKADGKKNPRKRYSDQ